MASLVVNPIPFWLDNAGAPLQGGKIYIGVPNTDPTTNPINIFQDEALSIPFPQPIVTTNGAPSLQGSPRQIFLAAGTTTFSIAAFDSAGNMVQSIPVCEPAASVPGAGNDTHNVFVSGIDYAEGVSTSLTLSADPGSGENVSPMYFDAAPQFYPEDFTVSGRTVTFTSAIPVGTKKVRAIWGGLLPFGTPGAGSVTDTSVAASAAIQSSKLSFLQAGVSAVARTVQSKLRDRVSVLDFGADNTGATDSTTAIAAAWAYVSTNAQQIELVFPQGIYEASSFPNFAVNHARVIPEGEVRLRYTGAGNAIVLDAGSGAQNIYDVTFGTPGNPFIIEPAATATNACFVRAVHHSTIAIKARAAGASSAGLSVNFAVCTKFYVTCSVNEDGGWYGGTQPTYGIYLTQRNASEQVSYCTFYTPIIEGPVNGIFLDYADGNLFVGGTSEGCTNGGVTETAHAIGNMFVNMDFEVNTNFDVQTSALQSVYLRCDTSKLFTIQGNDIKVEGGLHSQITVTNAALYARLRDLRYNQNNNGATISDSGSLTTKSGTVNAATGALDGPAAAFAITPSAGTYTNNRTGNVGIAMTGGTVTNVTLTRGGTGTAVYSGASLGSGIFETSPGDVLTWTGTPSIVNGYPRVGV